MPLNYSCFISYRHVQLFKSTLPTPAREFIEGFRAELAYSVDFPSFFDEQRLEPGDYVNELLAEELFGSACMVVLYTPNYFSHSKPFCSREYFGMLELEQRRLERLPQALQKHGLIIPIALRDHDGMLSRIKSADSEWGKSRGYPPRERVGSSFEGFAKKKELGLNKFKTEMQKICSTIRKHCDVFEALSQQGEDPFINMPPWRLPSYETVAEHLRAVRGFVPQPLPSKIA